MDFEHDIYGPEDATDIIVFAHGAGAGNQHPFIVSHATALSKLGYKVICFNFPYMQTIYEFGKKRPPNKQAVLEQHFISEIQQATREHHSPKKVVLIGKSMGGKIASFISTQSNLDQHGLQISGLVALGFPFFPPKKPEKFTERTSHFAEVKTPFVILQGERDSFGGKEFLGKKPLPDNIKVQWIPDGDHSFKPRKKSGYTEDENIEYSIAQIDRFISSLPSLG